MKRGLVFLNGEPPAADVMKSIDYRGKAVVCADGAYDYLARYCPSPDVLLGDFDSIKAVPSGVETKKFPVDKDYTDGHLAILELQRMGVKEAEIYGAYGGRPDHEYANFALLALAASLGIEAVIKGDYDVHYVTGELELAVERNKTVSIVPYTDVAHILCTKGLKFRANDLTLNKLHLIGMSNTAIDDEILVRVDEGAALVFVQRR